MTETDPLLRAPTGPCVVIDGKSLCHLDHDSTQLDFRRLELAITQVSEMLEPIEGGALRVWVDASLRPSLSTNDQTRFDRAKASKRILEGPSGIELDPVFLEWAQDHNAIVISKDRFRAHLMRFTFLNEPGRTFAPAFYEDDQRWVFIERHAPKSRTPLTLSAVIERLAATTTRTRMPSNTTGTTTRAPAGTKPTATPSGYVSVHNLATTLARPIENVLATARWLSPATTWTANTLIGPVLAGLVKDALDKNDHQQATAAQPNVIGVGQEQSRIIAGWYQDPTGRFELRWWDSNEWTSHVSSKGQQFLDPPIA